MCNKWQETAVAVFLCHLPVQAQCLLSNSCRRVWWRISNGMTEVWLCLCTCMHHMVACLTCCVVFVQGAQCLWQQANLTTGGSAATCAATVGARGYCGTAKAANSWGNQFGLCLVLTSSSTFCSTWPDDGFGPLASKNVTHAHNNAAASTPTLGCRP